MIKQTIENISQYVPLVFPLNHYVASNPLWDCIDRPIEEATQDPELGFKVSPTLILDDYYRFYCDKKIGKNALRQSIDEFVKQQFELGAYEPTGACDITSSLLFDFMTDSSIVRFSSKSETQKPLLISQQMSESEFDEPYFKIKQQCLDYLTQFSTGTERNFDTFWRPLVRTRGKLWANVVDSLTEDELANIASLLNQLGIPENTHKAYCLQAIWQFKGWAGLYKCKRRFPQTTADLNLASIEQILTLWLTHELVSLRANKVKNPLCFEFTQDSHLTHFHSLWVAFCKRACENLSQTSQAFIQSNAQALKVSEQQIAWIWQRAIELTYQNDLEKTLNKPTVQEKPASDQEAAMVFCIDVRSEAMRRAIEEVAPIQTHGFAGFFGLTYSVAGQNDTAFQYPPLLTDASPIRADVDRTPCCPYEQGAAKAISSSKKQVLSPFSLFDLGGIYASIALVFKNLLPQGQTACTNESYHLHINDENIDNLVMVAKSVLQTLSMDKKRPKLIAFCGHKAHTTNNPFQSSLECGACGGHAGTSNAVIMCQILNDTRVREKLKEHGITLIHDELFIPAVHNTTTEEITWPQETTDLSKEQQGRIKQLKENVKQACKERQKQKKSSLPHPRALNKRANDWAELVPELGLINNSALIIGPRSKTQATNLEGRAFLHCYDQEQDDDGSILESIFLGPVVVAHWINSQYYFSTTDHINYGSGNKTTHNIVPNIGVMQGNLSDIQVGLPTQSLFYRNERIHLPLRLFVYIYAPQERIDGIIAKHAPLKQLVENHWIVVKAASNQQQMSALKNKETG